MVTCVKNKNFFCVIPEKNIGINKEKLPAFRGSFFLLFDILFFQLLLYWEAVHAGGPVFARIKAGKRIRVVIAQIFHNVGKKQNLIHA